MWRARIHSLIARALITLALLESAWLVYPIVRRHVLAIEDTPAARGRRVAAALGCFGGHGPEGNGGGCQPGREGGARAACHAHAPLKVCTNTRATPRERAD